MFAHFCRWSWSAPVIAGCLVGTPIYCKDPESESRSNEVVELEAFIVSGEKEQRIDSFGLGTVEFIDEAELRRTVQSTLGETLAWQPGVSSSYFGAGASRPVIRGLEGYRVRLMQDNIGTLDVSDSSPDHGVALEPLLIREIDIHRGAGALLFGNSAIGGAVNAKSRLIAEEMSKKLVQGAIESSYDTVSNGKSLAGYLEIPIKQFMFNLTGSARDSEDYDIPGQARTSEYEKAFNPLINDPQQGLTVPVENPEGTLPNTFHTSESGGLGLTWISPRLPLKVGTAYSRFESEYGTPYQYGGDPNDLFGFSSLDLEHERFDLDVQLETESSWLNSLKFHGGYADYEHAEQFSGMQKDRDKIFDDALFGLHAFEARLDWYHKPAEWLEGVAGVHGQWQDLQSSFLAIPPNPATRFANSFETENIGLFLVETVSIYDFSLQTGFRYETQAIVDDSLEQFGIVSKTVEDSFSVASNLTWAKESFLGFDLFTITPAISYIERIPSATERFAFWPNPAIQRFLIGGDKDGTPLENEQSLGFEIGIETLQDNFSSRVNLYHYSYDNFIFLQDIKGIGNLAEYVAQEATFYGFEAEISTWRKLSSGNTLTLTAMSDTVRGRADSDLPRIPPWRVGGRVELDGEQWALGVDVRYAFKQDRVQPETDIVLPELETDSYIEVNLDFSYEFKVKEVPLNVFFKANNLLDEERRVHTSFVKDVAPLPARNFTLGLRCSF